MSLNGTRPGVRILFLVGPLMLGIICLASSCLGSPQPAEAPPAPPAEEKPAEPAPEPAAPAEEKPAVDPPREKPADVPKKLTERRLRFSFRAQLWEEVLQWFAEQAGLSLVMDHPPQGSFNYIDDKEYSPIEGIDLLNKVLMTKRFTLIRNEQMLMVIDLSEGIPQGIVPQVTLDDLKERGNFELVSVRFPLGRRDVAVVTQEITALLGPNGTAVSLPATKQIMVTDTSGIMKAIGAVIESISEPAAPKPKPKPKEPAKPEKPELRVHEIKTADPAAVMEVLKQLFSSDTFVLDEKNRRFTVHTAPSRHAAIEKVLETVDVDSPPERARTLEVYPVEIGPPTGATSDRRDRDGRRLSRSSSRGDPAAPLIQMLKNAVPQAQITHDQAGKQLVVWATSEEHAKFKATLDKVVRDGLLERTPHVAAYPLEKLDPDSTSTMFQTLLPNAQISLDTKSRVLVVLAIPADHDAIGATLEQMRKAESGEHAPTLKVYPVAMDMTTAITAALTSLVPEAQVTVDTENKRLVAIATKAQHEAIQATIDQLSAGGADRNNMLVVYPLKSAEPASVLELLENLYPRLKIVLDTKGNRLMAWARAEEHASIESTLEQLTSASAAEGERHFQTYTIRGTAGRSAASLSVFMPKLQELAPGARMTHDTTTGRLLVWGTDAEHARIAGALAKMGQGDTPETTPAIQRYSFTKADPTSTMTLLQSLVPEARLSIEAKTNDLIAVAVPADHAKIKSILEQLQPAEAGPDAPVLKFHPVKEELPADVMTLLATQVPRARITADTKNKRLMVIASPSDHEVIAATIGQVEEAGPTAPKMQFISLEEQLPSSVLNVIHTLVPSARVTAGDDGKTLMVVASPTDFEKVKETISQAMESLGPEEENSLAVYPVTPALRARAEAVLASIAAELPGIQILPDTDSGTISIWAKPSQHKVIAGVFEQLKQEIPAKDKYALVAYTMKSADAESVMDMLEQLFPNTQIVLEANTNRLLVWTRPDEHESIKAALDQIELSGAPDELRRFKAFSIKGAAGLNPTSQAAAAAAIVEQLQTLVPNAKLTMDAKAGKLLAFGTPSELEVIGMAVAELGHDEASPDGAAKLELYDLTKAEPSSTMTLLKGLVPGAEITLDATSKRLMVFAAPDDHEAVRETLDMLQADSPSPDDPRIFFYLMEEAPPTNLISGLQSLVPEAQVTYDEEGKTLMVVAKPADQKVIEQVVEEMGANLPEKEKHTLVVYPVKSSDVNGVMTVLENLFSDTQFTADTRGRRILANTTPAQHAEIAVAMEKMEGDVSKMGEEKFVAHPVPATISSTVITVLRELLPGVTMYRDSATGSIIAWGRDSDHELIAKTIEQLQADPNSKFKPYLMVYPPGDSDVTALYRLLRTLVPRVTIVPDTTNRTLSVFATAKDHETVQSAINSASAAAAGTGERTVETYSLDNQTAASAIVLLRGIIPQAQYSTGADTHQLVVSAFARDHGRIKKALDQLEASGPPETLPVLKTYRLKSTTARNASIGIRRIVPRAILSTGTDPHELIAWARPADHEKIQRVVDGLSEDPPPEMVATFTVYALDEITYSTAASILRLSVPRARITAGTNIRQLVAYAQPSDHVKIKETLLKVDVESTDATTTVVYQLASSDSRKNYYTYIQFLRREVPGASYTLGSTDPSQLIVSARPKDHEKIAEIIQQLEKEASPQLAPSLATYSLQYLTASDAMRLLSDIVPEADLNAGGNDHQFIAWATSKDHEKLVGFIADLDKEEAAESKPATVVYHLEKITASTARQVLRVSLPDADFNIGADPKQLIASARPIDHQLIQSTVDLIDVESPFEKESTVVIYTLEPTSRTGAYYQRRFLQDAAPEASITSGAENNQLVIRARPEDHKKIEELIAQLSKDLPLEKQPKAVIYALEEIGPDDAMDVLREAARDAEFSTTAEGRLAVWATPKDHEKIATVLEQIDVAVPEDRMLQVVAYALKETTAAVATRILQQAIPEAECSVGADPKQLIVRARPKDHELVKSVLDTIDVEGPGETEGKMVLYEMEDLDRVARYYLMQMLRDVVPEAVYSVSRNEGKMLVWGRQKDHDKIKQIIDQMAESPEKIPQAVVYPLKEINASTAMQILRLAYRDLNMTRGADPQLLIVWAKERDHAKVKATLEQIDVEAPEGAAATVKVYDMKGFDDRSVRYVLRLLRDAIGNIRSFQGRDPTQIVIWATPKDHEEIAEILDQLAETPETAHQAQIYNLKGMRAASARRLLQSAVPDAQFTTGADAYQLIAWARPDDHEKIQAAVDKLSEKEPEETAARMHVYSLETLDVTEAMRLLRTVVPEAQFGVGANARQLIVWARPTDHEKIQATIEEMAKEEPKETAPRFQVYTVEATGATDAIGVLQAAVPEAEFNVGADSRQLIAFARPAEHEKIKAALEQLATRGPEESLPTIKVYSLETAGASNAMRVLQEALPEAQFNIGDDRSKLIVWAYPEDHAVVKAAVEEIEADSWLEGNRQMSVYSVRREDVDTLMQLLDPVLRQHAQFVADDERESLIVWANKKYHEAIQKTIVEFIEKLPEPVEPEVVVYRFQRSDPRSAYMALRSLVPEAEIAYDAVSRNLVVSALPEYQKKVRATIAEIEREDAGGQAPELKIHRIRTADPRNLMTVMETLFRAERDVQLSLDADNDSLIAYAAPRHHERIAELITEVEKGALEDSAVRMELHSLKNVDTYSSLGILRDALDKMGAKADLSIDYARNALVAIARPEYQEKIRELLDELRGEDRGLEIFQLDYVEAPTAERAIRQLFSEESYRSAPQTEADYETQQLFIRGTAGQLAEIRRLLLQLGEVGLTSISGAGDSRLRVVPLKGDLQSIVEEIKRVWPQLRSNEMRIVTPADTVPEPEAKPEVKSEVKPEVKSAEMPKAEAKLQPKPAVKLVSQPASQPASKPEAESGRSGVAGPTDSDAKAKSRPGAPVTMMLGKDGVTIASDDIEALDELESLLRTLSQRSGGPFSGRNYTVFQLRNTSAAAVSQTLRSMLRDKMSTSTTRRTTANRYSDRYGYGSRPTPLVIVPDERLNTLFVQGSRSDRALIESLIQMLDTDEVPETSAARKPKMIPIRNARVSEVERTIRDVFASQLASGRSRTGGAAFAPRMAVDETTNTLIVTAPAPLIDEITELAESLDKKAGDNPAERLKIIQLKKANATRVEDALNSIIRSGGSRRR